MKQYIEREGGNVWFLEGTGDISSDPRNGHRAIMLDEIEAGEAEIIPYVEPVPDYADLRRKAYASWGDQLDMQFWDSQDGTTTWVDHVAAVKSAHPKP
tara:strand:- start:376 stop:669 length:294 start_codon:yes stop_codon:yes gene_type:complete